MHGTKLEITENAKETSKHTDHLNMIQNKLLGQYDKNGKINFTAIDHFIGMRLLCSQNYALEHCSKNCLLICF